MAVSDWSTTAASNTDVGGVNTAEGMNPGDVNNAIREMMAQIKAFYDNTGLLDANSTFTGNNTFSGNNTFTGVGGFFHAVKGADQTRNSTTTLADDSALTISLPVGRFTFEAVLFSAAGAGALKYGWTVPASTSMRWNTPQSTPALYLNETQTLTVSDTSTNGIMTELKGNVRILTAGTFALQWAQNTSNAADTSVLLNSWMRLQKLE